MKQKTFDIQNNKTWDEEMHQRRITLKSDNPVFLVYK